MSKEIYSKILEDIENAGKRKVKVAIVDTDGILRGKYIHTEKFASAVEKGFGFCNVVFGWDANDVLYDNTTYTGWHSGYPDALARIDLDTYRKIPWDRDVPFFLGEFFENDGTTPLEVCPRQVLRKVVRRAEQLDLYPQVGNEYEWFNFEESPQSLAAKDAHKPTPLTPGMFGYSILRSSFADEFFNDLMDLLERFRVPLEGLHTETGPGVYEAAIQRSTPLEAADRGALFKTAVKEIGQKHGIMASFMARWHNELPGCSGHLHQSLEDKNGTNLFAAGTSQSQLNPLFQHYLAGQIKYLPELLPMVAPTVNSYKRLVEGFWAPTRPTWGMDNRTCAFRIITGGSATRVEVRVPGSDTNPYLAIAASLGAGLLGVEEKLPLNQPPIVGNGYTDTSCPPFAANLLDAAKAMEESTAARKLFGDSFVDHFTQTRRWEWRQAQQAITDWELKRYFEII